MTRHRQLIALITASFMILTFTFGCAGRPPLPVDVFQYGDDKKGCDMLTAEISTIETDIQGKYDARSRKISGNVFISIIGIFIFLPILFGLDTKSDELAEIDALLKRRKSLKTIMVDNECGLLVKSNADYLASINQKAPGEIKKNTKGSFADDPNEP